MPIITALEPQRHDPDRVNLYLDHAFVAGLSLEVSLQAGLRVGDPLGPAALAELLQAEARQVAIGRALNFLSHRPRSEREVRQRLTRHGVEPEIVDAAVEKLERLGLIDDAAFARFWVEGRGHGNPRGRRALRAELTQKGVARELVAETLDAVDDAPLAAEALRRVARRWQSLEPPEQRQRAFAYLQRRGFGYEETAAAIRAWQQSLGDEADDWPTEEP